MQMDGSVSNYSFMHQPHISFNPPVTTNSYNSGAPSQLPIADNMSFQNANFHFQPFPPGIVSPMPSSTPLQISGSPSQNNQRPFFNLPPPPFLIPPGSTNQIQSRPFNCPPMPMPSCVPFFSPGFGINAPPLLNNQTHQGLDTSTQAAFPRFPNLVQTQSSHYQPSTMLQIISNKSSNIVPENETVISQKENLLKSFLQKFNREEKHKTKSNITVADFNSSLKKCFSLITSLQSEKEKLVLLLDSSEEKWETELTRINNLQGVLSEACSVLSCPQNLTAVQRKIKAIKRKRALKKRLKATFLEQKAKKELEREKLHQEIDKWFDNLKEKNEKMKREIEMKKEADNILSEVRRKIHEAKKTIEKLKVFEKLRAARQANALQKGLYLQPEHSVRFETKISHMQDIMLAQLSNYEQEEKALQVMLETEQEDRREEEKLWRKRKLMTFQQKKQKTILESLFGVSDEPAPDDPLFLFYQYQNSGNKSIDNLVQIRHHWDIYLSEEGEPIPLQWVLPVPPSNSTWEEYCTS